MPVTLIVNNIPYEYPIPGDSPGWGQGATGWAEEVTAVLTDLLGPNDIPETTFSIGNAVGTATSINGLVFNTGQVRAAFINYTVYRTSTSNPSGFSEAGELILVYDNLASAGNKWSITQGPVNGNSGIIFSVTDSGQVQYTSSDIGTLGYSAVIHFAAQTLGQ